MKRVKVLFFAADPTKGPAAALQLGVDVREVRDRVEAGGHASALEFDWRLAARPEDLVRALRQTRPRVVHFSGHGDVGGVWLTGPDGRPQRVEAAALRRIFEVFPHDVRLVVLSACHSRSQAEALAEVVGCAIGTSGRLMDEDAIRFDAAFYGAIAAGESVRTAFDQTSAEVDLGPPGAGRPELLFREGVDPARLFLVPRFRRLKRAGWAAALLVSAAVVASWPGTPPPEDSPPRGLQLGDCRSPGAPGPSIQAPAPAAGASTSGASSGAAADLAEAKALCAAGRYDDAFRLFRRAAAAGSAEALGFAGNAYLSGEGTHPEPELGIEMLREAAGKGDARSMITLATAYQSGLGVESQRERWAMHWLRKAATEAGDAEAMRRVGVIHRDARSDSALYWLSRAVDAGSADARVDLGTLYRHGTLVPRDTAEAVRQYRAAAGAGSARGLFAMGEAHEGGFGVPPDPAEAHRWYLKAACAGSADAMNALGVQYLSGRGVPADGGEAERWFRRARAAGSESAAGNLHALDAPERPRRWRGPVAAVLAWLEVPETGPPAACPVPAG